ncbi:ABC transporter ATP-binding protein [Sinorhizobium meliloti]|uniref:ABC transporter ATP-binding protein n=1 Tax=Rhizobium meliloti TaxID=382 RepID=UPI003F165958
MSTTASSNIVLQALNVSHQFGLHGGNRRVETLQGVSLQVRRGELISLIGPSGCGKTTLLNMFGGFIRPTSGSVEAEDEPINGPLPDKIAFVFQEHALLPWNTIIENIEIALKFRGVEKEERSRRARDAVETVGLTEFSDHYPGQLSGGMKQRASLARALSLNTDVILMDEPFAALDEQTRMILGEDMSQLLSKTQKTIVFVTHSLTEAVFLSDRIAIFTGRPGKINSIIEVNEPHPRCPSFVTSERFNQLRNRIFTALHDEVRKSVSDTLHRRRAERESITNAEAGSVAGSIA